MKCCQFCVILTLCLKPLKVRLLIFLNRHLPRRVGLTTLKSYFSCTFKITITLGRILFHLQSMELPQIITKTKKRRTQIHHLVSWVMVLQELSVFFHFNFCVLLVSVLFFNSSCCLAFFCILIWFRCCLKKCNRCIVFKLFLSF